MRCDTRGARLSSKCWKSARSTRAGRSGLFLLIVFLFPPFLCAQETPLETHRFWDRSNLIRLGINTGAQTLDAVSTQRFLQRGTARELNPLARPFVTRGWDGQAIYSYGLGVALPVGLSYLCHRWGWHKLERATPILFAVPSGILGGLNYRF